LFNSHRHLVDHFLAEASLLGVIGSYGIERLHPRREGRSEQQIGKKGKSNWRWMIGGKFCFVLNHLGLIVAWDCNTANAYDGSVFQTIVKQQEMLRCTPLSMTKVKILVTRALVWGRWRCSR
jgi:hypothetical protein